MSQAADFVASRTAAILTRVIEEPRKPRSMERLPYAPRPQDFEGFVPGTDNLVLRSVALRGKAQLLNAQANVEARANVARSSISVPVKTWALTAEYDVDQVETAMKLDEDLPSEEMRAAFVGVMDAHDEVSFEGGYGAPSSFSDDANVGRHGNGGRLAQTITDATPDQALAVEAELGAFVTSVDTESDTRYTTTHLAMPTAAYNKLAGLYAPNTTTSILNRLRESYDIVPIKLPALKNIGHQGRMVAFDSDPDAGRELLMMSRQFRPRDFSTHFEIPFRVYTAGFYWAIPLAARYVDNVIAP